MRRPSLPTAWWMGSLLICLMVVAVGASPDAEPTVTTSSARPFTSPPPHDTPPAQAANLLFTLLARAAVFDRAAGVLTLEGTHPVATVLSQAPVPHAARLPAARLANASAWTSAGAWLAGPHAVLEGTPVGGGRSVSVVVRLASPAVASTSPLTLRFAARLASPDGAGALPGGVVAYALAGAAAEAAGADGGSARPPPPASLPGPPPPGTAPPLRLSDAALFIDAFVAGVEGSGQGGAKQVSPYYGCYSSSLGSLAVFGSNCGGSEDWQYDPFTAGGSQYVGRR